MSADLSVVAVVSSGDQIAAARIGGALAVQGSVDEPDVGRRLGELIGGGAVVADAPQKASEQLARAGARATQIWDVLELAALLAPACPGGGLDRVSGFFGIAVHGSGLQRQLQRELMLVELLLATLERVDTQTLLHVTRLAAGLDWPLRGLFSQLLGARSLSPLESGPLAAGTPIAAWIANGAPSRRRRAEHADVPRASRPPPLDPVELARRLEPAAGIARAMPGYEQRAEQVRMAQLVAESLNEGGQLLLEAGTGTGKGLAYLLPAALYALRGKRRVVVSTATTNLQDQLFEHDLPLVQAGFEGEPPLRATVLKGRVNYLCLSRWQQLLHAGDLAPADRTLLIKTLFWLPQTASGDRAELRLTAAEEEAWQRVSAVTEACTPLRCAYHRIGVCFLARARRAAEESHIVIANHALLLSDIASRSRVLPEPDALIIDEAHHLEDEATQQLGWRLGERELLNRLERLWMPGVAGSGAMPEALRLVGELGGPALSVTAPLGMTLQRGERAALQLAGAVRRLFEGLSRLLEDPELQASGGDDTVLRITAAVRAGSGWQELEHLWAEGVEQLREVEAAIVELTAELEALPDAPEAARELLAELGGHLDYWRDLRGRLSVCVHQPGAGSVYWISGGGSFRAAWLNAAPIEVASLLRQRLFATPETSVLVSATLAIGGSFDYVKQRLGLEEAGAHALGSPFDYARAALLYVPNDLPDPTQHGYQRSMERTLLDVVTCLQGRTLVLFTSRAHLRTTYHALREPLAAQGINLLAQGIDEASRTRLLASFRRGSRVVLLGTNAFWEGIDVVGDALSCVMVTRLPFAVPTDPVYAARAEQFEAPFDEYAVPQAVLRLKQGFGRLIRSRSDRGAVVVLDRRVVTRFYGQTFLRSLPGCSIRQGPAARAGAEVAAWLVSPETRVSVAPAAAQLTLQAVPG